MENQQGRVHPFTCYFCNKLIENDTEYGHVSNCGLVLEPCANKCGSYVPRNMKTRHLKECKNKVSKSMPKLTFENSSTSRNPEHIPTSYSSTTSSLGKPRLRVDSQMPPNTYKSELTQLLNKHQHLDLICKQLFQNMSVLNNKHQESIQAQHNYHMQTQMQIEKMQYQNQVIIEWKRSIEMQIENIKQEMKDYEKFKNEYEIRMINLQNMQGISQRTEADLTLLKEQFHGEQLQNRESINDLHTKLNEFKDYFAQENAVVAALWNDHKIDIDKLVQDVFIINKTFNENKTKNSSLIFDVRSVSQVSAETSEKLEIHERIVADIRKELSQLKLDVHSLEESSTHELSRHIITSVPGRLLWKISDFSAKMESAKENDTILKSPIFYTHDCGYNIKVQVYLNGIKKWKGRHLIACLHVLKGDYDLLLKWPCHIEGTMILRDLYNHNNPTDFSKYISAKRYVGDEENEEPQESSAQYIFIPHSTLTKQNFIKDDTMFIEIRINSINRLRDETEL